jgi:phage regulator Rha-like protein
VIVSTVLVMLFTSRLRGGLVERVTELARTLAQRKLARGLFPKLEQACHETQAQREQLAGLLAESAGLRRELPDATGLGFSTRP